MTRIRWEPTGNGGHVGYVGTLRPMAFRLFPIAEWMGRPGTWALTFELTVAPGEVRWSDDPDKLKAEAERWLEEYVSSLGASFADHPADSVTIDLSERDSRAVLANALDEYAEWCRVQAEDEGDREWRTRWAEIADRMYGQVTEPGESAVTTGEGGP